MIGSLEQGSKVPLFVFGRIQSNVIFTYLLTSDRNHKGVKKKSPEPIFAAMVKFEAKECTVVEQRHLSSDLTNIGATTQISCAEPS